MAWACCAVVLGALSALVLVPRERARAVHEAFGELDRRGDVRLTALHGWLQDVLADARTISGFPTSRSLVSGRPFREPDPEFRSILQRYARLHAESRLVLLDARDRVRAASAADTALSPDALALARVVQRTRHDSLDVGIGTDGRPMVVVAACTPGEPGVVLAEYDPYGWLFPLLRPAPGGEESFLVRRGAAGAVFLTPAHAGQARPLGARVPAGSTALRLYEPGAARTVGRDERGVAVLASATAVPGTGWTLVLETPRDEVVAGADRAAEVATAGALAAVTALFAIAYALVLRQRRAAEGEIHRSRARFAALLDRAPDAILVLDPDGRIREATRHAEDFYGVRPGELRGQDAFARLQPPGVAPTRDEVRSRLEGAGEAVFETEHVIAGGLRIPVEISSRVAEIDGETAWIAVVRDLRARRADAARIGRLNRLLRATTAIGVALGRVEDERQLFTSVCDAAVREGEFLAAVLSRRRDDGGIERTAMAVAPAFTAALAALDPQPERFRDGLTDECLRQGRTVVSDDLRVEARFGPLGPAFRALGVRSAAASPVIVDGAVRAALSLYAAESAAFDVEALTVIERTATDVGVALVGFAERSARRRLEERLRALFATGPVGYMVANADGVITDANGEFLRLAGHDAEELAAGALEWTTPEALPHGGAPTTVETELVRPDGAHVPVLAGQVRLGGAQGEMVAVLLDLSPMRAAAESLRQTQQQLLQAQKMETVGRLAGGVAHDFNNLLTVIQGYAELMQVTGARDAEDHARIEQIQRAAERASSLTRQLLAFSRQQVLEPRRLDLRALVLEADRMLRRLMGERIEIVLQVPPQVGPVVADPGQLEQVLLNLVVNARDAMPRGGVIRIELGDFAVDVAFAQQHPPLTPGPYVRLAVHDDGDGIEPEVLPRIFEPFFTTKDPGKGTGLGLATVYGIVQQSGGGIWATSPPGEGAMFEILLPRVDGAPVPEPRPTAAPRGHGEAILLVEDEAMVRRLVRSMLEQHGYRVLEASDRDAALRLADAPDAPLTLLVTDVILRETTGPELAARVRRAHPELPVLFVSGYAQDGAVVQAQLAAGDHFLAKPFSTDALLRAVSDALRRATPRP